MSTRKLSQLECTNITSIENRDVILIHNDKKVADNADPLVQAFPQAHGYCQRAITKSLSKNQGAYVKGMCMRKMCGRWEEPVCADTMRFNKAAKYWNLLDGWDRRGGVYELRPTTKWTTFYQYLKRHDVTRYLKWETATGLVVWVEKELEGSERVSAPLDKALTYFQGVTQKNEFSASRGLVVKPKSEDEKDKGKESEWSGAQQHNSNIFFNNMPKVLSEIPGMTVEDFKNRPITARKSFRWDWKAASDIEHALGAYLRLMRTLDAQDASIYDLKEEN